jgi:type VI protein secretion system component VasF
MMMFQAIAEPMLMQWKTQAAKAETKSALTGTPNRGETRDTQPEQGTPRSRAKAKSWRDAPAILLRLLARLRMMRREANPDVLAAEPVAE